MSIAAAAQHLAHNTPQPTTTQPASTTPGPPTATKIAAGLNRIGGRVWAAAQVATAAGIGVATTTVV